MWFLRKRLTDEQKSSLERLTETLNYLTREQESTFAMVLSEMTEFLLNCNEGRNAGLGRPLTPVDDDEIVTVREMLVTYRMTIVPALSQMERIDIPDWAPSKFVKHRREVAESWHTHYQFLDTAIEGLEPPDPLVDQVGKAKLNMFVSGISLGIRMVKHNELKP